MSRAFGLSLSALLLHAAFVSANNLCPDGKNYANNQQCCSWYAVRDYLQNNIYDNICGEDVHETLRLSFHDAIGFSASGKLKGNGADGSMIVFNDTEVVFAANNGIDDSVDTLKPVLSKFNISAGDLIQFGAAVGTSNCPGAPRLKFFAGRPDPTIPAQDGTVPQHTDDVDTILARMADAGFEPAELIALLASHSIARADNIDPLLQAVPFDSTPFVFDTQIFLEVLLKGDSFPGGPSHGNNAGEVPSALGDEGAMRLQSDFELARDNRTACAWQGFINRQHLMMHEFKKAMAKLSVLGQDKSKLIDCSDVIPHPVPPIYKPASYPATKSFSDVEKSCHRPFPRLNTDPGQPTIIAHNDTQTPVNETSSNGNGY